VGPSYHIFYPLMKMKQPIAIVLADTHLSEDTVAVNFSVWAQAFALCKKHEVPLFHIGDIFTSRKGQTEMVLKAFRYLLDQAAGQEIAIIAIAGNHDKTSYVSESSFLDPFVSDSFGVISPHMHSDIDDIRVHLLPYYDEELLYTHYLNELELGPGKNILLTHVGIDGVLNNKKEAVKGKCTLDIFKDFDLVLIGHYHNRQVIDNIVYVGSAYQANFGEDINKGATILYDDATYEHVQFEFPEYQTYEIDAIHLNDALDSLKDGDLSEVKVRIKVRGEVKESQKPLIIELQKYAKVELEKAGYNPTDIVQSEELVIQDMLQDFDDWSKDLDDREYGRNILKNKL
jgi:exonuclease SbcD